MDVQKNYKVNYKYKHHRKAIQRKLVDNKNADSDLDNLSVKSKIWQKPMYESPIIHKPDCIGWNYTIRIEPTLGCPHECPFCFAKATYTRVGIWNKPYKKSNIDKVEEVFRKAFSEKKFAKGTMYDMIKNRYPIQVGVMSDPFPNVTNMNWFEMTGRIIDLSLKYDYPMKFITKGVVPDFLKEKLAQAPDNFIINHSFSCNTESWRVKLEPRTRTFEDRINCMNDLADSGVHIKINAMPLIPTISDNIEHFEFLSKNLKTDTITTDYARLSDLSLKWMIDVTGYKDLSNLYTVQQESEFSEIDTSLQTKFFKKVIEHFRGKRLILVESVSHMDLWELPDSNGVTIEKKFMATHNTSSQSCLYFLIKKLGRPANWNDFENDIVQFSIPYERAKREFLSGNFATYCLGFNKDTQEYSIIDYKQINNLSSVSKRIKDYYTNQGIDIECSVVMDSIFNFHNSKIAERQELS